MDKSSPEYQRYQAYLLSPAWAAKRQKKLRQVGRKCQYCGRNGKQGVRLQCHHKTYANLFNEPMEDLEIVCTDCHPKADRVRRRNQAIETFGLKKYGPGWQVIKDRVESEFDDWLKTKE
jgi:5-methylcytosine-specific restriction endonuclease McrA